MAGAHPPRPGRQPALTGVKDIGVPSAAAEAPPYVAEPTVYRTPSRVRTPPTSSGSTHQRSADTVRVYGSVP